MVLDIKFQFFVANLFHFILKIKIRNYAKENIHGSAGDNIK